MKRTINWGILGPGRIAEKFAAAFGSVPEAKLFAVGSRESEKGKAFASRFGNPKVYTRYEDLASDPDIDIIYVATPHPFHHDQTLLCLNHGKSVLCEKPLTLNLKSALKLAETAESNQVFLMEGMWSRFFPATIKTLELIRQGVIGAVQFIRADFGFAAPYDPESRVFNPELAGGAQLDVGVYPMFLALLICGRPQRIQALAKLAPTGVDETTSVQFYFENGSMAHILSSVAIDTPKQAEIMGSLGTITLHSPWHKSQGVTVSMNTGETAHFDLPFKGLGFEFQLEHVTSCLQEGLKESPLMSLDLSLLMAEVADSILSQCDVVYPHQLS